MSDYKPCPFCGGPAVLDRFGTTVYIKCSVCNATTDGKVDLKAVEALWNARVVESFIKSIKTD